MDQPSVLTDEAIAKKSAAAMWEKDYASQGLDMKLEDVSPGRATLSMELTQAMSNGHGTCHGGFIFTLADSALAFACNSYNEPVVAQQCSITFIAPGRIGDRLTASAREVSKRGRSGIYDIQVVNQKGEQIAEFRGNTRTLSGTHF